MPARATRRARRPAGARPGGRCTGPGHRCGAVRCRDERPRALVSGQGAGVGADDVQAQVDSGGHAGRGQHTAFVDVKHVRIHRHRWIVAGQRGGLLPVGGGAPAVEQARGSEHERARADGDHTGTTGRGRGQGRAHPLRWRDRARLAGHDDRVSVGQRVEALLDEQRGGALDPHRPRGLGTYRHGVRAAVPVTERVDRDAEIQRQNARQRQHSHLVQPGRRGHGTILSAGGIRATARARLPLSTVRP